MGVDCQLVAVGERVLTNLSDSTINDLFNRNDHRVHSFDALKAWKRLVRTEQPPLPTLTTDWPLPVVDLDRNWSQLLVFFTGMEGYSLDRFASRDRPIVSAILGRNDIGPNHDYGPARFLWADEVRQASEALDDFPLTELDWRVWESNQTWEQVYAAFNDQRPGIRPMGLPTRLVGQDFDTFVDLTRLLKVYYKLASERGNAILIRYF